MVKSKRRRLTSEANDSPDWTIMDDEVGNKRPHRPSANSDDIDEEPLISPEEKGYRGKKFVGTLNNWTLDAQDALYKFFGLYCELYVCGEEIGTKTETPHLQFAFITKSRWRFMQIFSEVGFNFHIRAMGKNAKWEHQVYCTKGENIFTNYDPWKPIKVIKELYPWQDAVYSMTKDEPDDRTINWVYDPDGNNGKSQFCKFLCVKNKKLFYFSGGKSSDITSQLVLAYNKNGLVPETVLVNVPRCNDGNISYNALEQIKDGLVNTPKYEGGTIIFNSPHVWVFSNHSPDTYKMTNDRWKLWRIEDKNLVLIDIPDDISCESDI